MYESVDGTYGFGLVVVVVADEIFDRVVREEPAEFLIELRREGLVVHHHERRPVDRFDDLRHGEGLAGAGDTQQHLALIAAIQPFDELRDGACLVSFELEVGNEFELVVHRRHGVSTRPGNFGRG